MSHHNNTGRISRLATILIAIIACLVILLAFPFAKRAVARANKIGCEDALASANRILKEDYLQSGFNTSAEQAQAAAQKAMLGWDDMCPAGGEIYLAERPGTEYGYEVVCGLHDPDEKERVRLNADNVRDQVDQQIRSYVLTKKDVPEELTVTLNSKTLTVLRVEEDTGINRGTGSISDISGTVAYFAVEDDVLTYLCFADENYCAVWKLDDGWTGDSYR